MSNVLIEEKKQRVIALGRLGWPLRRIEKAAHIRRETAGSYLRAAACASGLETGASHYHFVRRYLERNPQLPLSLHQVDPLIRQLTLYRDVAAVSAILGRLLHHDHVHKCGPRSWRTKVAEGDRP